ncbi:MAG: restriction endonuclease [Planctomycetota bacterium]|nr:MAG: restriction endonuclease [Planctomycetota bacterium]
MTNSSRAACQPTLPISWCWATGKELFKWSSGDFLPKKKMRLGQVPVYGGNGINGYHDTSIADFETFVIGRVGAHCGNIHIVIPPAWITDNAIYATYVPSLIHLRFVVLALSNLNLNIESQGGAQPFINQKALNSISLPIAPLDEQKRIVSKIEELFSYLDAGVATLKRVKENLKRYRVSILKAAVEGKLTEKWRSENPVKEPAPKLLERILTERRKKWEENYLAECKAKNRKPPKDWKKKYKEPAQPDTSNLPELPDGWCWATAEQLSYESMNGFGKRRQEKGKPVIVLRLADILDGKVSYNDTRKINALDSEISKFRLTPNDILVLRVNGSADLVGRMVTFENEDTEPVLYCDHFIRLKFRFPEIANWLRLYADSKTVRDYIYHKKISSAGQNTVSQTTISSLAVPLPPIDEISAIVETYDQQFYSTKAYSAILQKSTLKASSLRQSILKRAFEGKLVPQEPDDEPASILLERIKAEREAAKPKKKPTKKKPRKPRKKREKAK